MKALLIASFFLATPAFAITRVVTCVDPQTNNLEMQIVLRGGMANINVCPGDVCTDMEMVHAQTLVMNQTDQNSNTLTYVPADHSKRVVSNQMTLTFEGLMGDPIPVEIDGRPLQYNCF